LTFLGGLDRQTGQPIALARLMIGFRRHLRTIDVRALPLMVVLALGLLAVCPSAFASDQPASASPSPAPTQPAVLPPSLLALEQKMNELKITSLRFSVHTSIVIPGGGGGGIGKLLKVLGASDSTTSGEVTVTPQAANISLGIFGKPFTVRVVDGTEYVYVHALASADHGRSWIRLGKGGLAELFTVNGHQVLKTKALAPETGEPPLAEPPFAALQKDLAGAEEVRELEPATVYGQPATRFLAVLRPGQLQSESPVSATKPSSPTATPPVLSPPTTTLEVSLAQSGQPLQIVVKAEDSGTTTTGTLDIPAINFPLVIEAPPAAKTIGIAVFHRLAKKSEAEERKKRHKHGQAPSEAGPLAALPSK
jgi:hypothetical protein